MFDGETIKPKTMGIQKTIDESYPQTKNRTVGRSQSETQQPTGRTMKRMSSSPPGKEQPPNKRPALGNITNAGAAREAGASKPCKNTKHRCSVSGGNASATAYTYMYEEKESELSKSLDDQCIQCLSISSASSKSKETKPKRQSSIQEGSAESIVEKDSVSMQTLTNQAESSDTENKKCTSCRHKDIDAIDDPIYSPEYAQDVYRHMRQKENIVQTTPVFYLAIQPQITAKLRTVLVDWMVEVQESFELFHETLYLSVKYVDRYLSAKSIKRDQLQLIGTTAMLIASKFEETNQPMVEDFLYVCDDAYTREQLIAAECEMLHILEYNLNIPIAYRFLRRFARAAEVNMEIHTLARYICELTLPEYDFVGHKASLLAASALFLALKMKKVGNWTSTLEYYTEYRQRDLLPCVRQLNTLVGQKPRENASTVRNKYAHPVFYESSKVPPLNMEDLQLKEE